jgi:hypothetical protein
LFDALKCSPKNIEDVFIFAVSVCYFLKSPGAIEDMSAPHTCQHHIFIIKTFISATNVAVKKLPLCCAVPVL